MTNLTHLIILACYSRDATTQTPPLPFERTTPDLFRMWMFRLGARHGVKTLSNLRCRPEGPPMSDRYGRRWLGIRWGR